MSMFNIIVFTSAHKKPGKPNEWARNWTFPENGVNFGAEQMDTLPSAGGVCNLNWMRIEKQISPVPILSKLFFKPVVYVDVRGPVQTSQYACRQHNYETHTQTQYTNTRDTKILPVLSKTTYYRHRFLKQHCQNNSLCCYTFPFSQPTTHKEVLLSLTTKNVCKKESQFRLRNRPALTL